MTPPQPSLLSFPTRRSSDLMLDAVGQSYEVDSSLVRGLDYYTRTVFEFTSDALGAQSGVGGGGRYDGLIEQIGGPPRSEEHTSELQSQSNLVCRLLLEKKKT